MESPEPILSSSIVLDESQFLQIPQQKTFDYSEHQSQNQTHNYSSDHIVIDRFAEFAKQTFRRYEESNQRIESFRLHLITDSYSRFGFATEWTLNALKLGATDLTFRSKHPNISIPLKQAVFGNKNVVRLCLESSTIDRLQVTECPGLKSLTLRSLTIRPNALFDVISCCPSVEDLSLSKISWHGNSEDQKATALVPTLILHDLRSLVLRRVYCPFNIKTLFLDDLSSKFPNLKHLTIAVIEPLEAIRNISSASIETLNISLETLNNINMEDWLSNRVPKFEFDVVSIRKFIFEGIHIPDVVSVRSVSGNQWEESRVSITNANGISAKWFCQLSNFLTKLRGSKIHLCLHLHSKKFFDYDVAELDGLDVSEVEDLTLDMKDLPNLACHAFLDGLFRICRPKTITQYAKPPENNQNDSRKMITQFARPPENINNNDREAVYRILTCAKSSRNNDLVICRLLEQAMQVKSVLLPTQFMYGFRDLEEIDAQQLIDEVWKPQPLSSVLADAADSTSQKLKTRFRFQLKWKPSAEVVS